eukprot:6678862-Alexandrium_andersonii.AAC.1
MCIRDSFSIYGFPGDGGGQLNQKLVQDLGENISALGHSRWVAAGNWNLKPEELAEMEIHRKLDAAI